MIFYTNELECMSLGLECALSAVNFPTYFTTGFFNEFKLYEFIDSF